MKLEDQKIDQLDLSYEIAQPGVSVCQFEEGIQKLTNEKSGKTTLRLPMVIDRVVEGPAENEGRKLSHFVPIETEFGERQLAGILTITGLINGFSQKFGEDVDAADESFLNALKIKLPGKFVKATHELRKDQKGKDQVSVIRFERFATSPPSKVDPGKGKAAGKPPAPTEESW